MDFIVSDSISDFSQSFTDRYFAKRYILNVNDVKNNDIMLMFHSNRIICLTLAPSHFVFKKDEDFKLNFLVGKHDRLSNSVRGKGKKGGQLLMPNSVICKVEYEDGDRFDIPCGVKGTLMEINEQLIEHPELLKHRPDSDGFIAIIVSNIAYSEATKNELMTHKEYLDVLKSNFFK